MGFNPLWGVILKDFRRTSIQPLDYSPSGTWDKIWCENLRELTTAPGDYICAVNMTNNPDPGVFFRI